jgi:hypothetical protein
LRADIKNHTIVAIRKNICKYDVKNAWSYTITPPYAFMMWYLIKHRDDFTFTPGE